jgi:hypothetical protein
MLVGNALRSLTDAMRKERIAQLSYQGDNWELDGENYISATKQARQAFEGSLGRFVDLLSRS